jgi:hypothetical protein
MCQSHDLRVPGSMTPSRIAPQAWASMLSVNKIVVCSNLSTGHRRDKKSARFIITEGVIQREPGRQALRRRNSLGQHRVKREAFVQQDGRFCRVPWSRPERTRRLTLRRPRMAVTASAAVSVTSNSFRLTRNASGPGQGCGHIQLGIPQVHLPPGNQKSPPSTSTGCGA